MYTVAYVDRKYMPRPDAEVDRARGGQGGGQKPFTANIKNAHKQKHPW